MSVLNVDNIKDRAGTGAVGFPNGVSVTGVVTASSFVGNGENLTGIAATITVSDDTSTNSTYYPIFTTVTTGIATAKVSSTKLTYNPSTGTLSATDVVSSSDATLKTNIQTVENPVGIVNSIRGVSFDWKETGTSSYGVIAQEIEKVLPELVFDGESKSVNYNGLIGILIESVKQLSQEVEDLKKALHN